MTKHSHKYSSKELLDDEYFIQSMLNPTDRSDDFWLSLVHDDLIDADEFEHARNFVNTMKPPIRVMSGKERTELWIKIEIENKKNLRTRLNRKKTYLYSSMVACLLIAVGVISYFFVREQTPGRMDIKDIALSMTDDISNEIQLILPDNETIELNEKSADIVIEKDGDITINSKKIGGISQQKEKQRQAPASSYNHLIVPYGRHSSLTLSDGTKMHINSGSKVVFPNHFSETERQIFVNGEVYLEVVPNKKAPFYIRTDQMDVQVLGTTVNVTAYEHDNRQSVVLVTGSVKVITRDKQVTQLSPSQMLDYSNGKRAVSTVNTYEYTCWKDGYFIYTKESLGNIMNQLSRYYGVKIVCDSGIISTSCSGKLDLKENLNKVMQDLSDILRIDFLLQDNNEYKVKKSTN